MRSSGSHPQLGLDEGDKAVFCTTSGPVLTEIRGLLTPPPKNEDMQGTLLRARGLKRSPFLLDKQELHKSLLLVLSDDDNLTLHFLLP